MSSNEQRAAGCHGDSEQELHHGDVAHSTKAALCSAPLGNSKLGSAAHFNNNRCPPGSKGKQMQANEVLWGTFPSPLIGSINEHNRSSPGQSWLV